MERGYKLSSADIFTFLRIVLIPFIIIIFYAEGKPFKIIALILFLISALTDYLDGLAARKKGGSEFGKMMDPLADKILINSILGVLTIEGMFSRVAFIIMLNRDLLMSGLRSFAATRNEVIAANLFGKIKTGLQYILISIVMFGEIIGRTHRYDWFVLILTSITVFASAYSFIEYLFDFLTPEKQGDKILMIANSRSRGNFHDWRKKRLFEFARNNKARIRYFSFPLEEKIESKYDKIMATGGDGTFQAILNEKKLENKVIGFFPFGGGNAMFHFFYPHKETKILRDKISFKEQEFDVIELTLDGREKIKTMTACIGFDAETLRRTKREYSEGWIDYTIGIAKTILMRKQKKWKIVVSAGDRRIKGRYGNITIGKFPYYGYKIKAMFSGIKKDDGNVYSVLSKETGIRKIYENALLTLFNIKDRKSKGIKSSKIIIECSEKMPVQSGGEFLGYFNRIEAKVVEKRKGLFG